MKLDPGFPSHWKTERAIARLGAEGVLCILRLLCNAQIKRKFSGLQLTPKRLAMETKWLGDENLLFDVLTDPEAPWLDLEPDGTFTIHGFAEHQHQVVKLWENGKKGGRPPKVSPTPSSKEDPSSSSSSSSSPICEPNGNHMVSVGESGADAYEAIPTGNKPHLLDLERKVQSLRAEWRLPLSYAEQQALLGNARCLDSLSAEDWQTIRDYLQARIPQGVPAWQPRNRHKFLETCADVASHAFSWKQKQEDRRPAPQRPTQIQPRKLISREELAEAFSPIRNHEEKV